MTSRSRLLFVWLACAGCSGGSGGGDRADARVAGEWTELVAADWDLAAGSERFHCARRTLEADLFVTAFRPLAPEGTHHTASASGPPSGFDGDFACSPEEAGTVERVLFASGVGTDDFVFPPGVALRIPAGEQITLNLHLFNPRDGAIAGRSGMLVKTIPPGEVVEEAVFHPAGTESPVIPPDNQPVTATSFCTFDEDATIFDLWPHMHQIGRHMTATLGGEVVLDVDYSFAEQVHYPMTLAVRAGDQLRATCTWVNDTGVAVETGNSSTQEMCVLGFYVAPGSAIFDCSGL